MIWHVRKFVYLSAVSLLTCVSSVHAEDADCKIDLSSEPSCTAACDVQCAPPCDQICAPPCCPTVESCKWSFRGDLLYWKVRGSNINYIADYERFISRSNSGPNYLEKEYRIKTKSLNFDRNFGFRLGAYYKGACSCWDLGFLWTHYCTHGNGRPQRERCLNLSDDHVEYKTRTKWDFHLNFWDFEAAQTSCIGDCVALRGCLSIRGATLKQNYYSKDIYVANANATFSDANIEDFYKIKEDHDFYGAGPRVGLEANWLLGCGWSLYGQAAAAFLVGYSEHQVCDDVLLSSDGPTRSPSNIFEQIFVRDECLQANRVITDLSTGIRWNPCLVNCCYNLIFQLGWEYHTIFGQKHAFFGRDFIFEDPFLSDVAIERHLGPCKSTLAVYGLNFSVTLEF